MTRARTIERRTARVGDDWPAHVSPLLRRIYSARGALTHAQAAPRLLDLLPPDALSNIDAACALLADAIARDAHIVVVGDFDCDGATACAVGVRGLRMLGAKRVSYAVPNRMLHGYGLSPALVDELAALQPDLLLTVDHGIACHAGIAAAKARGWTVVVTDHHLPGEQLPPADCIVNPNQRGDGFASKSLAGVGVVFYVLLALRRMLRDAGIVQGNGPDLSSLLDLVAVGTVADLVPLDANNRALVSAGLRRLRAGHGCAGLQALIAVSRRQVATLGAGDIGYAIAPRINAAGRLEDMSVGIACLLTDDATHAATLAATLEAINAQRRAVQQVMVDEADVALAIDAVAAGRVPRTAHCLFNADWHPGVIGLVASKAKERLHRPVVAFAPGAPGETMLRGSARSIPGFHIRDALAALDSAHPGLIVRFGGHAMAAGLTLEQGDLARFEEAFCRYADTLLDARALQEVVLSDGALLATELDHATALALREGGPWGQGFAEPLFDGTFVVLAWKMVGQAHLKLELRLPDDDGTRLSAIHFNGWSGQAPPDHVHLAYRLEADDYRGGDAIQLVVQHCAAA